MRYAAALPRGLVLDAPCGFGRNALALAVHGFTVLAADHDRGRLASLGRAAGHQQSKRNNDGARRGAVLPICVDLSPHAWCFPPASFDLVLCVHYDFRSILPDLKSSVRPGGFLYIETFGGQGENYLCLPATGYLRAALADGFDIRLYAEKRVGPRSVDAVSVKIFAQKTVAYLSKRPGGYSI
jgi:SAM-dependent methyltransferase